jgi:hypothetical protein
MKRVLVATILGMAAVVSTYGQGKVALNTYAINSYAGAAVLQAGVPITGAWNAQVISYVGTGIVDAAGSGSLNPLFSTGNLVAAGTFDASGFIQWGPDYIIANYPSSGGVAVQVELAVFNGASYASSLIRGHSAVLSLGSIAVGLGFATPLNGLASFSVEVIPEPSTFALAGLGAAAMLIFRRRS